MGLRQTFIFAITVTVLTLSTRILSRSVEPEANEDHTLEDGIFEKLSKSCPPDLNSKVGACELKANEAFNSTLKDPTSKTTVAQHCRNRDDLVACRKAAYETCKSQLAQVDRELNEEADGYWFGLRFDCKALKELPNTNDGNQEDEAICPPNNKYLACINMASNNVSIGDDYAAKSTYPQHCRNKNDMLQCFNAGFKACTGPFAQGFLTRTLKGVTDAYSRFDCEGAPGSGSARHST